MSRHFLSALPILSNNIASLMSGHRLLLGNIQHVDVASTNKKDIMHSQLTITMYMIDTYSYNRLSTIYVVPPSKTLCNALMWRPKLST